MGHLVAVNVQDTLPFAKPKRRRSVSGGGGSVVSTTVYYIILTILACFSIGPLVVFFFNSLKGQAEIGRNPVGPPESLDFGNYALAWERGNLGVGFRNSAILVFGTVALVCVVAGCASYAMARLNIKGADGVVIYLLVANALPIQMFLVPLFSTWSKLHLYDTHLGLILIYAAIYSPFATLLLRSFMLGIPADYENAARIDGCNEWQVMLRITLPMAIPGFLTIALTTALSTYNEFLLALVFIQSPEFMPVATSLFNFQEGFSMNYPLMAAAGLSMVAPMLLVFLILQRRFTEGVASVGLAGN